MPAPPFTGAAAAVMDYIEDIRFAIGLLWQAGSAVFQGIQIY